MTTPSPISAGLADWQRTLSARVGDLPETRPDVYLRADEAELAALLARRAANRALAYTQQRPSRYADATYDRLLPEQDPGGKVSRWWAKGPRTLVLAGPARTGKTTAAYAVANAVHDQDVWVWVRSAAGLSAALKPDGEDGAFDNATQCTLLILDDLGRERVTDWWLEQLQRVVDERCNHERRMIVTCNSVMPEQPGEAAAAAAAYDQLIERYGHPIVERIIDGGGVVIFDGPAVREVVTEW